MSPHSTEISLPPRIDALPVLLDWLNAASISSGMAEAHCLRLQLVIEELFLNTVNHGFQGKSGPPVELHLNCDGDEARLRYADAAPPFDTCHAAPSPAGADDIGGLGLALIRGLCRTAHYRRENGYNVTELCL